uniref:F-box domain-containing protein n=1 Tax=Fagus sylvatica TaxID=28930 RepID=A0A2N9GNM0_FAGSY
MAHTTTQLQQKQNNAPETTEKYDAVGEEMERHRKRRKRKKPEKQTVQEETKDPLEVFGTDIMLKILSNLDARSVALCLLVSRAWHAVASSDRLWAPKEVNIHSSSIGLSANVMCYTILNGVDGVRRFVTILLIAV